MIGDEALVERARRAALNSYSPYSRFRVGAALLTGEGEVYTGANVENAAYPVSNCAEVTAVNTAVASGVRSIENRGGGVPRGGFDRRLLPVRTLPAGDERIRGAEGAGGGG